MFKPKRQVLFYYPQHFNRSAEDTNPYFDPLLQACDKYGISYLYIEEPDGGTDKPRNNNAIKGDAFFLLITILRKILSLFNKNDLTYNEKFVARLFNVLTFNRFRFRHYVTISGSMLHFFGDLNKEGQVYDMQHGVLYKHQATFFDEHQRLRKSYYQNNLHWLFWGSGYEQCFIKGEEELFKGRTHVVGYPISIPQKELKRKDLSQSIILFSLQLVEGTPIQLINEQVQIVEKNLEQLKGKNIKVLLKHHPRFNNAIDVNWLVEKYPFASFTDLSLQALLPQTLIQVTIHSTTAFEYAEQAIPSYFIDKTGVTYNGLGNLFYSEYHYPLYYEMSIGDVIDGLKDQQRYEYDSQIVKEWYSEFYDEFKEQVLINLLKK